MALWFTLRINEHVIVGTLVVRREDYLDLADPGIADKVSSYVVTKDGRDVGSVTHRYGDGAWVLVRKALELVTGEASND